MCVHFVSFTGFIVDHCSGVTFFPLTLVFVYSDVIKSSIINLHGVFPSWIKKSLNSFCPGSFYYGRSSVKFRQDFFIVEPEWQKTDMTGGKVEGSLEDHVSLDYRGFSLRWPTEKVSVDRPSHKAYYQVFFWVLIDLIVELLGLIIKHTIIW